jgi:hypothetical protein
VHRVVSCHAFLICHFMFLMAWHPGTRQDARV